MVFLLATAMTARPTIDVETSRAIGGGEQITRFIYGATLGIK
jgi:hypothetical protein